MSDKILSLPLCIGTLRISWVARRTKMSILKELKIKKKLRRHVTEQIMLVLYYCFSLCYMLFRLQYLYITLPYKLLLY